MEKAELPLPAIQSDARRPRFVKIPLPSPLFDSPRTASIAPSHASVQEPKARFTTPKLTQQLSTLWEKLKKRVGSGSLPPDSILDRTQSDSDGASTTVGRRTLNGCTEKPDDDEGVDEVVVDSNYDWSKGEFSIGGESIHERVSMSHTHGLSGGITGINSEAREGSSFRGTTMDGPNPFAKVWWRVWPAVQQFFNPVLADKDIEESYQRELWFTQKITYIIGSAFLVLNWVLIVALLPRPWSETNKYTNYVIAPISTVPLLFMAMFDGPRNHPWIWQIFLFVATTVYMVGWPVDQSLCNFWDYNLRTCQGRDFLSALFYASSLPVVGLFACGQSRLSAAVQSVTWFLIVGITTLPTRISFLRTAVNVFLFHIFVLAAHYRKDISERRLYLMRAQLKVAFKAKQRAQTNERKTMDSNRRFTSYIFHEVRVPLNTAVLAVQNLKATNAIITTAESDFEYQALRDSLEMMSKVLNDVLDFSKMERGGFVSTSRSFSLHAAVAATFGPTRIAAQARGLQFETVLDPAIDEVARRAALMDGEDWETVGPTIAPKVMGDNMRLRQIISNLTSNACKFTNRGGKVTVRTKLIYPMSSTNPHNFPNVTREASGSLSSDSYNLSENKLSQHRNDHSPVLNQFLVVRFEVTDEGIGIRRSDMRDNRLFSAYVQTEMGRRQGGKGTGLGLSLVRQIVMLSGGRLGVFSKPGEGSTFWVEMPFLIGPMTRIVDESEDDSPTQWDAVRKFDEKAPTYGLPLSKFNTPILQGDEFELMPRRPSLNKSMSTLSAPGLGEGHTALKGTMYFENGPLRVLVVDDDSLTRKLMTRMLERLGCIVTQAENGEIGLNLILGTPDPSSVEPGVDPRSVSERQFEITFLDNQMPVLSGLQVVQELRALGRQDLVIGVTANALTTDQEEYIACGASDVLTKPVAESDLKRFLRKADYVRSQHLSRALPSSTTDDETKVDSTFLPGS